MNEPTVLCVCLTRDRPAMLKQAVACYRAQAYANKRLYVLDNGIKPAADALPDEYPQLSIMYHRALPTTSTGKIPTVGALRNHAISFALSDGADIIAHLDDDDWSHANRLAEQVALLQSSGADCVGYSDLLFWREPEYTSGETWELRAGEAWLYTAGNPAHCPGTSMMYWRKAWEARPFEALPSAEKPWQAEDQVWQRGVKLITQTSFPDGEPRMIARIHGGNTSRAYDPELMRASEAQGGQWKRVPAWDEYCRGVFK